MIIGNRTFRVEEEAYIMCYALAGAQWGRKPGNHAVMNYYNYIFSNDKIVEKLEKISIPMGIITLILGITFTIVNYGANFGSNEFLTNIFTNIYIWFVILSAFGLAKKFLDFENKFTKYMNKNNFSFYVLHYTIQIIIAFVLVEYFKFSHFLFNYIILFIGTIIILPIVTEILKRIPIANKLLLGVSKRKQTNYNK